MDSWCELVYAYPGVPGPRDLAKALRTADALVSKDLAPFEIEWLVETFFFKPVSICTTVESKRHDESWTKTIRDAFKVISKIVCKYWSHLENVYEDIATLCSLSLDTQTKKEALNCLINVLKNPGVDVGSSQAYIEALQRQNTCKAPLALLVGTICRYYPERVDQQYKSIWRNYLNMLKTNRNKYSDTVMKAVLQGIDGLFINFGAEIPTNELNDFYNDLTRNFAKIDRCIEPLLSTLKSHAAMFKENLANDRLLRTFLWNSNNPNVKEALLSVYNVVFNEVPAERIMDIIRAEIQPMTKSESSLVKHTALRVLIQAKVQHNVAMADVFRPDDLEFHLRNRPITHQEADLISLYFEASESYVRSLLETVIKYYDNIPAALRQDVLVKGILGPNKVYRKGALNFLIDMSREGGLHKFCDVWRAVLTDDVEGEAVLDEVVQHMVTHLTSFLDGQKIAVDQVLSLTAVLSFVLCASEKENRVRHCGRLRPSIAELACTLCLPPASLLSPQFVCVEMFENKTILGEFSFEDNSVDSLSVMQDIFSKDVVDTKLLIKALSEMDSLLKKGHNPQQPRVSYIMKQILKLKSRRIASTSDDRVLQRNLSMFIGEHNKLVKEDSSVDEVCFMGMKNKITITIHNVIEATNYKIDLLGMLSLASEDAEMLYCLLVIITVNCRACPDPGLQSMLWRCIHGLARCGSSVDVAPALKMCATAICVQQALDSISEQVNPEVRRKLCSNLQVMLIQDPGSATTTQLLTMVAKQLILMISSHEQATYECGIDIATMLLTTLQNDALIIEYLPKILILTSRKIDNDLFRTATDMFIEKCDIFNDTAIRIMISGVVRSMKVNLNRLQVQCILMFLKKVFELKKFDAHLLLEDIYDGFCLTNVPEVGLLANLFQILALSKQIFEFDTNEAKSAISKNNSVTIDAMEWVLKEERDAAEERSVWDFLKEYAKELLCTKREETIKYLSTAIEKISSDSVAVLRKSIFSCINSYKILENEIKSSFDKLCIRRCVQEINEILNEIDNMDRFTASDRMTGYTNTIRTLCVVCSIFDYPVANTNNWTQSLLNNDTKLRQTVVSDLLSVSNRSLSDSDFESILTNNQCFVTKYLDVYFVRALRSETISLDKTLFVAVVKMFVDDYMKYKEYHDKMRRLFISNWRMLECDDLAKFSSVVEVLQLPRDVAKLVVGRVTSSITSEDTNLDLKIKMITLLPGGDDWSDCYRYMAGLLPTRLSEIRGDHAAIFRALLDSLASTGDLTILNIVVTLAAADGSKGWWDDAIRACMEALAEKRDEKIYAAAYEACHKSQGLDACQRVFVPLLRYSSVKFFENYMKTIIEDVLSALRRFEEPTKTMWYRDRLLSYAKAFTVLQVAIDKLPVNKLESGIINGSQEPWHLVKTVCKYSVMLRDKVRCPENAGHGIPDAYLRFQCAAYNCLTTAICKHRPAQKIYSFVFNMSAWTKIVDPNVEHEFQRTYRANDRTRRQPERGPGIVTSTYMSSVRTRIFMDTPSENPLNVDLIPVNEDDNIVEEDKPLGYENHPLNAHGCLTAITLLLEHASSLEHKDWLTSLTKGLTSIIPVNAKWTLAQAICYAEVDLKPHASMLAPALLELISKTPKFSNGKRLLNNLHIDILWTIIKWDTSELSSYDRLNSCLEYLISSCLEYRSQKTFSRWLLSTLNRLLQLYSTRVRVQWTQFKQYELTSNAVDLLPIFQRILSNGIPLPELLPAIFKCFSRNQWTRISKLPEVFGLALSLLAYKNEYTRKFWQNLDEIQRINVNAFVKVLLNAQATCPSVCNQQFFRIITNLAPKVETSKCLKIIAKYLETTPSSILDGGTCSEMFETIALKELLDGHDRADAMKVVLGGLGFMKDGMRENMVKAVAQNCRSISVDVRKSAFAVIMKVFRDLFLIEEGNPVPKRRAVYGSRILDAQTTYHKMVMEQVCRGLFDQDMAIAKLMRDGIEECLSEDMAIRLAELFYLIFYFAGRECPELSDYGYVFLELLFSRITQQEAFRKMKLSEVPLPASFINIGNMTNSTASSGQKQANINPPRAIDAQIPVVDIFEVFLQSAKGNSQICQELCVQIMRQLQGNCSRFDLDEVMAKLLADVLKKQPGCLFPLFLETSRIFMKSVTSIESFKNTLHDLRKMVCSSDALFYYNILYEDLLLRSEGRNLFDFSIKEELDTKMKNVNQQFSIEGLTSVFSDLSNWDDLRIQDKSSIEMSLPPLLVKGAEFKNILCSYFRDRETTLDYSYWFNKVAGSYYSNKVESIIQYKENWLRDIEVWPARDFVTSAVIEAIKWPQDGAVEACDIKPSECLAEWAARLMIRSAYYERDVRKFRICRQDELKWCSEANRKQLPHLALQCIERNSRSLLENEVLSWFHQKVEAHRMIALRQQNNPMLLKALQEAENHDDGGSLCLTKVILQLQNDLGLLSKYILDTVNNSLSTKNRGELNEDNSLKTIHNIAMNYYDAAWDCSDITTQEEIICEMLNLIEKIEVYGLSKDYNLRVSILMHRLTCFEGMLSEGTAKKVLDKMVSLLPSLDSFSMGQIGVMTVFPDNIWTQYKDLFREESLGPCKEYLQLVCHPQYTLIQCCKQLMNTNDLGSWNNVRTKMKSRFESSHVGTDYISLNALKYKLFAIDFDMADRQASLTSILMELSAKPDRSVLLLSQLSPRLSEAAILESQRENLRKLLCLPPKVYVEKFSEQVRVFMDSLKRPCVISAELSNGVNKKYIIKTGEPLANDASVQRAISALPQLCDGQVRGFNVTMLSEESAIIEYLEDHERLAELMGKKEFPTYKDDNPELSPERALEEFRAQCSKLPVITLRSAIESSCTSIEQFIAKKRMFLETLSTMTITNWLFGLGDRHLDNIMLNKRDGSVVAVDWASLFQFGLREFVPARLTANLLAVCDVKVLESRLQSMLTSLRENHRVYEAFVRTSFYWKGPDFNEMTYIESILQGKMVSHQITRDVMDNNPLKNKEARLKILDSVFEKFTSKETYSVEEQVSCLLQHCTSARLLSIIRREWTAWA